MTAISNQNQEDASSLEHLNDAGVKTHFFGPDLNIVAKFCFYEAFRQKLHCIFLPRKFQEQTVQAHTRGRFRSHQYKYLWKLQNHAHEKGAEIRKMQ